MHFHVKVFSDNEQQKVYYYSDFENQLETYIQKLLTKQVLILMDWGVKEMDFRLLMQLACLLLILPCWIILPFWKIRPKLVRLEMYRTSHVAKLY